MYCWLVFHWGARKQVAFSLNEFFESIFFDFLLLQESAGDDIPIMLLGNKTDKEMERQVQKRVGERLAKVCSVLSTKLKVLSRPISVSVSHQSGYSNIVVLLSDLFY